MRECLSVIAEHRTELSPTIPKHGTGCPSQHRRALTRTRAHLFKAQGAGLFNAEVHYDPPARLGLLHQVHLFCEAENLANRTYVGSALNVTDSLTAAGAEAGASVLDAKTGSIFAGAPRSVFGGVRVRF